MNAVLRRVCNKDKKKKKIGDLCANPPQPDSLLLHKPAGIKIILVVKKVKMCSRLLCLITIWNFFHLPGFFTQTLSVASVTDMRYVVMVVFVRERREVLNVLF